MLLVPHIRFKDINLIIFFYYSVTRICTELMCYRLGIKPVKKFSVAVPIRFLYVFGSSWGSGNNRNQKKNQTERWSRLSLSRSYMEYRHYIFLLVFRLLSNITVNLGFRVLVTVWFTGSRGYEMWRLVKPVGRKFYPFYPKEKKENDINFRFENRWM